MIDTGFNQQLASLVGGLIAGSAITWAACLVWFRKRRWYVLTFCAQHEGSAHFGVFLFTNEERMRLGQAAIRGEFGVEPEVLSYNGQGVLIPAENEE